MTIGEPPKFAEDVKATEQTEEASDRLTTWKRKLLDLTLANKLLNFKGTKSSIEVECSDLSQLEDRLANGKKFKLLPRTDVLSGKDERSAEVFRTRTHEDGRELFLQKCLERGEIYTAVADPELNVRLTELFRTVRTSFEEGGANTLFLALGFLKWQQKDGTRDCLAPVLLIPVALRRKSVMEDFSLVLHEDEPRFNPTLLELLQQDFRIDLSEFQKRIRLGCRENIPNSPDPYSRAQRLGSGGACGPRHLFFRQISDVEGSGREVGRLQAESGGEAFDRNADAIFR
jgi:Protein of unknown function (DUF4011)